MSKRDRYTVAAPWIVIAVTLAILGGVSATYFYSKGYQRANEHHQTDNKAYQEAAEAYRECVKRPTTEEAVSCYSKAEKTSREDQRSERDLNAQREMADWAEGMLWVTGIIGTLTIVVTTVGVVYVANTLEEARKTTTAAIAGTAAANLAADLARHASRAWLELRFNGRSPPIALGDGSLQVSYEVKAFNVGATPALSVKAVQFHRPFDMDEDFNKGLDEIEALAIAQTYSRTAVFPGKSVMAAGYGGPEQLGDFAFYVAVAYQFPGSDKWCVSSSVFFLVHYLQAGAPAQVMDGDPHVGPVTLARMGAGRIT